MSKYIHMLNEANRDCEICFCDSLGAWVIRFKSSFRQVERAKAMVRASKLYEESMNKTPPMHKDIA